MDVCVVLSHKIYRARLHNIETLAFFFARIWCNVSEWRITLETFPLKTSVAQQKHEIFQSIIHVLSGTRRVKSMPRLSN